MSDSFVNKAQRCPVDVDEATCSASKDAFSIAAATDTSSDIAETPNWTLQIKPVGEQRADFAITLHPDDDILQLYEQVSAITGLAHEQQRLIYRGRLIPHVSTFSES
jgi:Ubiquitin family